jgi:plastocyanin
MQRINLNGAELSDAMFHGADVSNARLNAVTTDHRIIATNTDFSGSSFNNIDGLEAFFHSVGFGTTSLVDTTFFGTTIHHVTLHDSSIQLADFRGAIVTTGILEPDESRLAGYWWYNTNTSLDCINHVICNNPPPESFRDIYQVEPEPETFRDVKINPYESWYGAVADGDESDYYCYEMYTCYHPQVATILSGGTVNWIYDEDDVPTHTDPTRKIIIEPESEHLSSFSSPNIEPGERWSHTFTMPGKYHYYDKFNPDWVGQVIVFGKIIEGSGDTPDNPTTENPPPKNPPPENPPN